MKHLDLIPVANTCKKMLYKGCLLVGLVAACSLTACSDDDENSVAPVFPELQTISCNAGETKEFTFEANTNWSLASTELWCKFVKDDVESFVLSGKAGTQNITIRVTDEAATVDEASVAKLELTMGSQTIVIGEVTRSAKGSELKIYDMEGNELEALTVGYDDFEPFKVKANFHFAVTGTPNWVEVEGGSLVGVSNQEVAGGLRVIQDGTVEKYPVAATDNKMIVFSAEDGKASFSFPLIYAGMDPMDIDITLPEGTTHPYNWAVSMDGTTFVQESSTGASSSSDVTFTNRLVYTIKAFNDKYVYLYGVPTDGGAMNFSTTSDWLHIGGEQGNVTLMADAGQEERTVYVLAFSQAELDAFNGDYSAVWDGEDIAETYRNKNLLIQLTQKNIVSTSTEGQLFGTVTDGYTGTLLESSLLYSGDRLAEYQSKYGVSSVLEVTIPSGTQSILVGINFELDTNAGALQLFNAQGESAPSGVNVEPYMGSDENMQINVTGLSDLSEDVLVVASEMASSNEEARKVMVVIHPTTQSGGDEEGDALVLSSMMGEVIPCSAYTLNDADALKAAYSLESIWTTDAPQSTMLAKLASGTQIDFSGVRMYQYVWGETSFEEIPNINGELETDYMGGVMIYSGNEYGVSGLFGKDVLIVIPDTNGKKYGLTYAYWGSF